ncbi:DUF421 domain-containing protein [Alteromonas antoniana]|uniref:DUF421 domain-containing protein n=1 Tax=Alteromonas antoniana TaxID=2803813 RepID=UPI001C48DA2A|nr:YetF domain-containing protein [Alteromonas antoniana]
MFVSDTTLDVILRGLALTAIAMFWVVLLVRINGLRSFSKMTSFDFVMTVAIGSLLASASQVSNWQSYLQAIVAMATLFIVQYTTARIRKSSDNFEQIMQNSPVLLMRDGVVLHHALKQTRVAESDLVAKLREANVLDFADVRAVVLETTGDISVLHGSSCSGNLLAGVRRLD